MCRRTARHQRSQPTADFALPITPALQTFKNTYNNDQETTPL